MPRRRPVFTRPYNALLRAAERHAAISVGPSDEIGEGHGAEPLGAAAATPTPRRRPAPKKEAATA